MPKILFIEDELTQNVNAIIKFHAPVLNELTMQSLQNEDFDFPEDVLEACSYSSVLDIAYTFPDALRMIIKYHSVYDFILIDRNLEFNQSPDELNSVRECLTELGLENIDERMGGVRNKEGDLLLQILLGINPGYKAKTYFLTANAEELIKESAAFKFMVDWRHFAEDHIIEKGSPRESVISEILNDIPAFGIQNDYADQCRSLRKWLGEESVSQFIVMVDNMQKNDEKTFLMLLRNTLESMLNKLAESLDDSNASYWDYSGKKKLNIRAFYSHELDKSSRRYKLGFSRVVKLSCDSIYSISSDHGVHAISSTNQNTEPRLYAVSAYTVRALMNQICDVILWMDQAMDILAKR